MFFDLLRRLRRNSAALQQDLTRVFRVIFFPKRNKEIVESAAPNESCEQLFCSLQFLSRHHGRFVSRAAILHGLPLERDRLNATLLERAAANAHLEAQFVERSLDRIPKIVLPTILFCKTGLRILIDLDTDKVLATVIDVTTVSSEQKLVVPLTELNDMYSGYAIFCRPLEPESSEYGRDETASRANWFWRVVLQFKENYAHIAVSAFLVNMIALAFPLFTMAIYDRVLPNFAVSSLVALSSGVVVAYIFDVVIRVSRSRMIDMTGKQADVVLASRIFEQIMNLKLSAKPIDIGVLANQIRDFDVVREFFTSTTMIAFADLMFSFLFILVMILVGGPLALVPIVMLPIVLAIGLFVQKPLDRAVRNLQAESSARHGILIEGIAGLETIKALGAEGRMQYKWERSVAAAARSGEDVHILTSTALTLSGSVQQFAQLIMYVWGVMLVMSNSLSVGALVASTILAGRVLSPVSNIVAMLSRGAQTLVALRALDRIMNLPVERPENKIFTERSIRDGSVAFEKVTFTYPEARMSALQDVSFVIAPGERVGIIGKIGSGKTTVGRLLSALYEPEGGRIRIDGIDLRQYDPVDIRKSIGFVQQDVDLFHGSLRENIILGKPDATDEDIVTACRLAGVDDFVANHPEGYDLPVTEGGRSLSGGQRQSIALARILIRKPKILFMDEPTSALDMKSEQDFCLRLDRLLGRDTTFIVSTHRVSLLHFVERLIVFDGGRVVVDGPKDAVLKALESSVRQERNKRMG